MTVALSGTICLLATTACRTGIVPEHDGQRRRYQALPLPGATVNIKDEATGLALTTVTDSNGVYTIRNVTGGTYTLRATLQGFKEFVQTGIPVTAGSIVRINGKLEIGALTESVTVTTEAALLKTDKADVSTDLKPADVVNLPLNQYRNYQYSDEPGARRDAARVPERADRHARTLAARSTSTGRTATTT